MRLLLAAFGRVLVDLAVLEPADEDDADDDAGPITDPYPLGFTAEPAP